MGKWGVRFLNLAKMYSDWSRDPSTQVGAVIVNDKNQQVGQGYNGFPRGMDDDENRYKDRNFKYKFILHAEENAILNSQGSLEGCTIFIWPFLCCTNCASKIIQSGITKVVYPRPEEEHPRWSDSHNEAKRILRECEVDVVEIDIKKWKKGFLL